MTSLVCVVFNFLKSNMQNILHLSSFSRKPLCLSVIQMVKGAISPFTTLHFVPHPVFIDIPSEKVKGEGYFA